MIPAEDWRRRRALVPVMVACAARSRRLFMRDRKATSGRLIDQREGGSRDPKAVAQIQEFLIRSSCTLCLLEKSPDPTA